MSEQHLMRVTFAAALHVTQPTVIISVSPGDNMLAITRKINAQLKTYKCEELKDIGIKVNGRCITGLATLSSINFTPNTGEEIEDRITDAVAYSQEAIPSSCIVL
ncbi:hypothetical protein H4R24_003273 [Coemansia sp. RSA 988]|nr:hypothetical protein H4R24_003273 [Coemansia sp. RSA 988]